MADAPKPLNLAAAADSPAYPEPVLGNPASTLMESGVGNCYPGLEFDLRQLDVRFFPGLAFEFRGIEPSGPDGTQGAHLLYADTESDTIFDQPGPAWLSDLKRQLNGPDGAALGSGDWYLHWVEQYGRRIEFYDFDVFQNAVWRIPYEGETSWWIIRMIEADPNPDVADLTIALTRRDETGQPTGAPIVLKGKRRRYLDENGVIPDAYRAGELTASMCSPWTHDFRDCACQYWASNHPDVVLGPAVGPQIDDGTSERDARQAVTFLDWMRRREPGRDVSAATTIERARPSQYDPYEINLKWEELSFVLQGEETDATPVDRPRGKPQEHYGSTDEMIRDLTENLAPLEFTLSMDYLYAYFSLRMPDEVTEAERAIWPDLADDLRAARQFLLLVALSEMTHLRWVNQTLWMLERHGNYPPGSHYRPVIRPVGRDPGGRPVTGPDWVLNLRPARPAVIEGFVEVERPGSEIDTEYAALVHSLRHHHAEYPPGLYQLAVRIDSDGMQHYQRFRDMQLILGPYAERPELFLRRVHLAEADDPAVQPALGYLREIVDALKAGYEAERKGDMPGAEAAILSSRASMRELRAEAERLARGEVGGRSIGIPFFALWERGDAP